MSIQSNMNVKFLSNLEMLSFLFLCDRGSQKRPARSPKFESLMLYLKIVPTFKTYSCDPTSFPGPFPASNSQAREKALGAKAPRTSRKV